MDFFFLHLTKGSLSCMYRMNDYSDSTPIRKKMGKICENGAKPLILHAAGNDQRDVKRQHTGGFEGGNKTESNSSSREETDTTLCL